ncbi:MAG: 5-(carboxyamino)imidazole ribonucleotide synthase [Planctomycetota bacterium]
MSARFKLAILGGGQLARMLALAAAPLGVRTKCYDPSPNACAGDVCSLTVGTWDDADAIRSFADDADAVTYEFESVRLSAAEAAASVAPLRPGIEPLRVSQERLLEKQFFTACEIPTPAYAPIDSRDDAARALEAVGAQAVIKTRRDGYDGKGQRVVASKDDAVAAWDELGRVPMIAEAFVEFRRELSVVAVRSEAGDVRTWPLCENTHEAGMLRRTVAPATATGEQHRLALSFAQRLLSKLEYGGVLTLELFETASGDLLANEFAPRVHNSGHWTIEAAKTSQFANHVRAVLGMPLGSCDMMMPGARAEMVNVIGDAVPAADLLADGWSVHDYTKEPRPGRKVGHATRLVIGG